MGEAVWLRKCGLPPVGVRPPPLRSGGRVGKELIGLGRAGLPSTAATWSASPVSNLPEGSIQPGLSHPSPSLIPTLPRAEYLHGKHGVDVEVQGPHETQDGQLLIRLDLNHKEMLTLRLQNGGTQPVTLTHVLPLSWTPQFDFYNGDQKLPCSLGPGEWVSKEMSLWWMGLARERAGALGTMLFCPVGSCLGMGLSGGVPRARVLMGDHSPSTLPLIQSPSPR